MRVLSCRRTVVALFAITCLTVLGYFKATEVAASIASIALGVAAANAFQGKREDRST